MAKKSGIAWTERVWNPVSGCSKVSSGCANCYAEREWPRFLANNNEPADRPFTDVKCHPDVLDKPFAWTEDRLIFVNSTSDVFHEDVPFDFVDKMFAVMALTPRHTYQILTKRPERMLEYFIKHFTRHKIAVEAKAYTKKKHPGGENCDPDVCNMQWPLPNVWFGVTAENQATADLRLPILMQVPAAKRFVSIEPMIGPINLNSDRRGFLSADVALDIVIVGGESGRDVRRMNINWVRALRDECKRNGKHFFFKQWGEWKCFNDNDPAVFEHLDAGFDVFFDLEHHVRYVKLGTANSGNELDGELLDESLKMTVLTGRAGK